MSISTDKFATVESVRLGLKDVDYIATRQIAHTVYLAYHLGKPVLVEGPAGVGKTELAKAACSFHERSPDPASML